MYRVQSVKVIVYCGVVLQIKYTVDRKTDSFLHYSKKEPVKSFVGMFRKMKISLYDN